MDAFHAASLISPSDSNLSYTYSPNTISPQALEMLEHSQQDVKTGPKKRKSWGQVLPEPKTNLPPRKRAKTEDEKEQRRIERVKRNRLAAHNSRERKRAEVDQLTQEKQCLEAQMQNMQVRMNQMHAQLLHYQKIYGVQGLEGSIMSSPPVKDDLDFEGDSAYNSSSTSTIDPREASFSSPGPSDMSTPQTHIEDYESHPPAIKAESTTLMPDLTQHSAAMLCDLQCRSEMSSTSTTPSSRQRALPNFRAPSSWLVTMAAFQLLCLTTMTTLTTLTSTTFSTLAAWTPPRTATPSNSSLFTAISRTFSPAWNPSLRSALSRSLARASLSSPTPALARPIATSLAWPREVIEAAFPGELSRERDSTDQQEKRQRIRLERLCEQLYQSFQSRQVEDQIRAASLAMGHFLVSSMGESRNLGGTKMGTDSRSIDTGQ